MSVNTSDILAFLSERVLDRWGPPCDVNGPTPLDPGARGHFSFASKSDDTTSALLARTRSSFLLIRQGLEDSAPPHAMIAVVANPRLEFARICKEFFLQQPRGGIHPTSTIDESATLGPDVTVEAGVVVGARVRVGARTHLGANCVIGDGCTLGEDVAVGPGTVIGYSGFGYERDLDGTLVWLPHFGAVTVGDRVEIGANTAIDRGTMTDTVIEDDVKIDNLVHIAHNCVVREGALVIASSVLCGGVTVGDGAWVSPNSVIKEHITVGARATVGLSATALRDVSEDSVVVGSPARPLRSPK